VCVVTGATRGIGRATALSMARLGYDVVLVGRDAERLESARADCARVSPEGSAFAIRADLASFESVRRAAAEIAQHAGAVHVLVNNAGVNSPVRETTVDGHELTFQVNCLSPFLLTSLLVPALTRGAPSRVVDVTSVFAHLGRVDLDDLNAERRPYNATRAYTQSKLASAMLSLELARELGDSGIAVNCVSPGLVATDLLRRHWYAAPWLRWTWSAFLLSPETAAARIVRVATSDAIEGMTGRCFASSTRPVSMPRATSDVAARQRLLRTVAAMTGVTVGRG
jgi:NAD(P)-dependent dehydrogenase (short-subunit alcohol dehydrogenase family)